MKSSDSPPIVSTLLPWAVSADQALRSLQSDARRGLEEEEASRRIERFGANRLAEVPKRSWIAVLAAQFKSLIILLLAAAAALSFSFGDLPEGLAVIVVIVLNAAIGFTTELRAVRSMEALAKIGNVVTRVLRGGNIRNLEARLLVPGDIVVVDGGDILAADLRLLEASKIQADESALTGESLPVTKHCDALAAETVLAERANMLFKGTAVVRGSGLAVVSATGMQTELGKISSLVEATEEEKTPLEKRLNRLGNMLIWITLVISAATALAMAAVSSLRAARSAASAVEGVGNCRTSGRFSSSHCRHCPSAWGCEQTALTRRRSPPFESNS